MAPNLTAVIAALILCGTMAAATQRAADADVLLQKAKHAQTVAGDLREAIRLYETILALPDLDRPRTALALLRVGDCYQKLGRQEARGVYERIVRDFPDVADAARDAKTRLARLAPKPPAPAADLSARRVWSGPDVDLVGDVSRDGRYMTFVDWSVAGNVMLRDMSTGESRPLTSKKTWLESIAFAEWSRIAPDGRRVAYTWFTEDWRFELRLTDVNGATPRILLRDDEISYVRVHDWSPDSSQLLVMIDGRGTLNQMALVNVADGRVTTLQSFDWRFPGRMAFSPDGRFVAYDLRQADDAFEADIFVLAVDGSRQAAAIQHPANDQLVAWLPDGRILFSSDRLRAEGLWSVAMSGGKAAGQAQLVKADFGRTIPLRVTSGGTLYYGVVTSLSEVYTATLDSPRGTISEPKSIGERFLGTGMRWFATWSPDSEWLAFANVDRNGGPRSVPMRNMKTGQRRELPLKLSYARRMVWARDGRSLFVAGTDLKGRQGLYRIDTSTADVTPVVEGALVRSMALSRDGRTLFYEKRARQSDQGIFTLDLESRAQRQIFDGLVGEFALSPDGTQIAIAGEIRATGQAPLVGIGVLPASGGVATFIHRPPEPPSRAARPEVGAVQWSADGRHLLFVRGKDLNEIWRLPVAGGDPQPTGVKLDQISSIVLSPDGRQLAIAAGQIKLELWSLEGLQR